MKFHTQFFDNGILKKREKDRSLHRIFGYNHLGRTEVLAFFIIDKFLFLNGVEGGVIVKYLVQVL